MGSVSSAWAGHLADRLGRWRIMLLMGVCMALGIAVTLASALWAIVLGLAVFTFGYFATHAVASGWVGRRARERRGLVSVLYLSSYYLSSYYLGGSALGSAAGWPWAHWGWSGVVCSLLGCVALVIALAWYLGRLGEA